ncbi:hypothetical protein H9L39_13696, partial [Fusarium oxysporum f. sp. albedinis]
FSMPGFSADVIEKIRDYRHSLETLHLDLRDVIESSPPYRPDCTFHDFEKLEHVFLNTRLVFHTLRDLEGIDGPTVEDPSLHLVWDDLEIDRFEQGLLGLVDATTDHFHHLKLVGLDYAERLDETVHQAMLEARIEFTYERWPVSFEGGPGAEEPDDEWMVHFIPAKAIMTFQYNKLPNNGFFRIFELKPGKDGDPLQGNLRTYARKETPKYEALSYVWGFSMRN